jgi:hypothetical protein
MMGFVCEMVFFGKFVMRKFFGLLKMSLKKFGTKINIEIFFIKISKK